MQWLDFCSERLRRRLNAVRGGVIRVSALKNPNSETRNPKEIRRPRSETARYCGFSWLRDSAFLRRSDFGVRIWFCGYRFSLNVVVLAVAVAGVCAQTGLQRVRP